MDRMTFIIGCLDGILVDIHDLGAEVGEVCTAEMDLKCERDA